MPADGRYSTVALEDEAIELINDLINRQMNEAARAQTLPNVATGGDSDVKRAFWLLLSMTSQRAVFLKRAKNQAFWPRIRSLIGAPPFAFLKPEDDGILNAAGIAIGRVHMAPQSEIPSAYDVGSGQFVDDAERVYRHVADDTRSTQIPTRRVHSAKRIVLDVRVAVGLDRKARISILKKNDRALERAIVFPKTGERVLLSPHSDVGGDAVLVTVRTVQARGPKSPVARLYCTR